MSTKVLETKKVDVFYGNKQAIKSVDFSIEANKVTAMIGPSGCGKSTLLRCFNRMNDFIPGASVQGEVLYKGHNIYGDEVDPVSVRTEVGMVFQKPNPFPKSIFDNIVWGPKMSRMDFQGEELVERCLRKAALWDEVKDRLNDSALALSGGQQQRLCIARAIAMNPEVILMDEPCSALDPKSTQKIEELISDLGKKYTIVIVTHNMQQAARVSEVTSFFYEGEVIEVGETTSLFSKPVHKKTEDYITGRFG